MIIHPHIARTAGSGIRMCFENKYAYIYTRYHRTLFREESNNGTYDFLCGHIPYGVHRFFPNVKEYRYFVFLREPLSRWKSFFNKEMQAKKGWANKHLWLKKGRGNLNIVLRYCLENDIHCNMMVKKIAGTESPDNILQKKGMHAFLWARREKKYSTKEMEDMLEKAKYNLKYEFEFVGFQERFDDDFNRLCKLYNLKNILTEKVNHIKPVNVNWNDKNMNVLSKINRFDIELYRYALGLY